MRLTLRRLLEHGLVNQEERAAATYYVANRSHLAWPAVEALISMADELERRIAQLVAGWRMDPTAVALFGSAARRDGSTTSDIDLLIIAPAALTDPELWESQCAELAESVESWTGNRAQLYVVDTDDLRSHVVRDEPVVTGWWRDARTIVGTDVRDLLRSATG